MIVSALPIWIVDIAGSLLMILFSSLCLRLAFRLRRNDRANIIWAFLFWVCGAFFVFAVSRSAGHIVKQLLLLSGRSEIWEVIRPYSGGINTFTFIVAGSVTLFFERTWQIYRQISKDKQVLQETQEKLLFMNQNLENLIKERTRALALSEYKYRRIFEVSKDMILVTRKDGVLVDLNPSGRAMLGLGGRHHIRDLNFRQFLSNADDWSVIHDSMEKEGSIGTFELDLKSFDGATRRVLLSASLETDSGLKNEYFHFLIKDIEQQWMMREQIAQADKLASIGELSSGIAHEINNPLNVILGYTQLLIRNEEKASERYADLKTIEKHVRNCKAIVADLLNFARPSKPKKERVDIHGIIDEVLNFLKHHSDLDRITIERSYDSGVEPLLLDEKKIKQVLINLIMNARHAAGKEGKIRIETRMDTAKNLLSVRVIDNGYGVEKKNLPRIFDPFFTTKPTGEGTGLGLSVSYGIVKSHGGDIYVESQPGEGATFTVELPMEPQLPRKESP